jgi:hypothetical protein
VLQGRELHILQKIWDSFFKKLTFSPSLMQIKYYRATYYRSDWWETMVTIIAVCYFYVATIHCRMRWRMMRGNKQSSVQLIHIQSSIRTRFHWTQVKHIDVCRRVLGYWMLEFLTDVCWGEFFTPWISCVNTKRVFAPKILKYSFYKIYFYFFILFWCADISLKNK